MVQNLVWVGGLGVGVLWCVVVVVVGGGVGVVVGVFLVGFFGEFLLSHVIGYGALGSDSIHELWWLMVWLGGMLVGGTLGQLSSAALYSIGDTRTPTRFGVISYSVFIPIKALLFYFYGIKGLSFAVSMFSVINFAFQHFVLTKKHLRRVR